MTTSPLRIAVDARSLADGPNGFSEYTRSVVEPLLGANFDVTLLSNGPLKPIYDFLPRCRQAVFGSRHKTIWEQVSLPRYLQSQNYRVYFSGSNRGIPWLKHGDTRYVLGLLDVIPYKFPRQYMFRFPYDFLRYELLAQLTSIWRADSIITISERSAADIGKYFRRRDVIPLLLKLPDRRVGGVATNSQFVYIGGVDPRKRIDNLLRAFAEFAQSHPDYKLILIGRGYEVFGSLISSLGIGKEVEMTGVIDEKTKMEVIASSTALVYPSLYEGYGLAIAEGLQAGVPVIAGAGGSQPEIGGAAVIYIDPESPAEILAAMNRVLDPNVAAGLKEQGRLQLEKLTDPKIEQAIADSFKDFAGAASS